MLDRRLRDALARLNPELPLDALADVFRKPARLEGSTLEARNRAFHRMLVQGVNLEYHTRRPDIVLFVNGLPLGVIEFKNPADEGAGIGTACSSSRPTRPSCPPC